MEKLNSKELLKSIEISREGLKNSLEVSLESYIEIFSRLDLMSYIILNEEKTKV